MITCGLSRLLLILQLLLHLSSIVVCDCNVTCCDQNVRCCFQIVEGDDIGRFVGNARLLPEFSDVFDDPQQLEFVELTFIGGFVSNPLEINATSGMVTTTSPIDRENVTKMNNNNCFYKNVNLRYRLTGQQTMTRGSGGFFVDVLDLNDNSPQFESPSPVTVMAAETNDVDPAFVCSSTLVARDIDAGVNAELNYTIVGNPNFTALYDESNVRVCIENKVIVDRETTPSVELILEAADSGFPPRSSNVTVLIQITDVNDNDPVFQHSSPLMINVAEDTPVGSVIFTLNATDKDIGPNAEISYTIQANQISEQLPFVVNSTTGVLTLMTPLDFDEDPAKRVFSMNAIARNTGFQQQMTTLQVIVNIIDVNDNRPSFEVTPLASINISEPLHIVEGPLDSSSALITFRARDDDSGLNGMVMTNVTDGYNFYMSFRVFVVIFRLLPVVSSIDREQVNKINLTIVFYDQGSPSLNATARLTVVVEDINDNAPMLTKTNFSVPENIRSGVSIAELQEYYFDPDNGSNGTLREVEQLTGNNFVMVSNTGSMRRSTNDLDRESNELVEVQLRLFDQGTPELNSTVTLYLQILDLNDNSPSFNQSSYTFYISENELGSIKFGQVMAVDPDNGKNGTVEYEINDEMSFFTINSTTGYLSTNRSFDRESNDTYVVTVVALDQGNPPETAKTMVTIKITDKNDEAPVFVETFPTCQLPEGSSAGLLLCVVQATDPDEISELRYKLSGQGAQNFNINNTGAITTAVMIVGKPGEKWILIVNVTDGTFSNTTSVSITIMEPTVTPFTTLPLVVVIGSSVAAVVFIVLICLLVTCVIFTICRCRKSKSVSLVSVEAPRRSSLRVTPSNIDREISIAPSSPTALSKSPTVNFSEEVAVQIYSEQTPAKRRYETVVLRDNLLESNTDGKEMEMPTTAKSSPPILRSKAPISPPLADELSGSSSTVSEYPSYLPPPHPPHSAQSVPVLRADVLKEHDRVYSEGNMLAGSHSHFPLGIVERAMDDGDIATYPDDDSNFPAAFPSALHHYITPGHSNPSISVPVSRLVSQSASPPSGDSSPTIQYVRSSHPRSDAMYYSHELMKLRSPHGHYHDHDRHHHMYEHSMTSPRHQNGMRHHHYSSSSSSSQQTATELSSTLPHPHYPPPPHHHLSRDPPLHLYPHMNGHIPLHPPPAHYGHHPPPLPPSAVPHASILPPPPMHTHYPSFTSEDNSTVASSVLEGMLKFDPNPPMDGYDPLSLTDDVHVRQPLDTGQH